MLSVIKKTLIVLAVFLVTPIVIIAINWQWQPSSLNSLSEYLFWITETSGMPWAILTCLFFTAVFIICLKPKSKMQLIKLLFILFIAMFIGQVVKTAIKTYTAESRPFVLWIEAEYQIRDEYFYSLPRSERREVIKNYIADSSEIPHWLYRHWRNETGYTFPSGHTLFATTWAFLALMLLNFKRRQMMVGIIIAWAILIELSRLALGMHHPIDLIVGAIVAWLVSLFCYYLACKWLLIEE